MNVLHLFDCRSLSKLKLLLNLTLIIGVFYLILFIKRKASEFNKREFEQLANDHARAHIHSDYSIFFIESNYNRKEFTTKEMCAIESAAKTNPNALIQVYTFTARLNEKANAMLNLYPNIRIVHFEPGVIFKDTPLLQWWFNGAVLKSPHSFDHIADAFRIAALWKYGGIYSDLDTITLKSFKPLIDERKNGVGYVFENYVDISNSLMIFQSNLEYTRYVMEEFAKNYDASIWDKNGPILIAQSLLDYCDIDNIHRHLYPGYKTPQGKTVHFTRPPKSNQTLVYLDKSHKCHNLSIFPQSYFHPFLFYPERNLQFLYNAFVKDSARDESYWQAIQNSYSVHFYDKITYEHTTKPGDKSFYDELTSLYCTFTYSFLKENDLYFDSNYKKFIFF